MMTRHRQVAFPSPFTPDEIELDPDKGLWIPGRKRIFIPSAPRPAIDWGYNWNDLIVKPLSITDFQSLYLNRSLIGCDECIPSRRIFTCDMRGKCTEPQEHERQEQIRTWNDIRRSEVPMFRRNSRFGILYDRNS